MGAKAPMILFINPECPRMVYYARIHIGGKLHIEKRQPAHSDVSDKEAPCLGILEKTLRIIMLSKSY